MKRPVALLVLLTLLCSLTACGGNPTTQSISDVPESSQNAEEITDTPLDTDPSASQSPGETGNSNILIAYFTWADNTVVEDPSRVDVDATTSASVLAPGNAAKLASWIQQEVGGDLHSIVVEEPYSSDYDECLDRAADEKAENARPALASHVDNMEDYDIVFLGFPNWWYTLPMPVLTFVEEYDWSGKTVVPFVTHGTGGLSSTIRDLTAALPEDVTILEPIGVYRPEVDASQSAVQEWIAGLDLELPQGGNGQTQKEETNTMESTRRIRFSLDDGSEIIVQLNDNPAAEALYEMLPIELSFEDFNSTEKIAYLTEEIPSDGSPDQCDPDVGSLCYYIPWGNLCFFYRDFRPSSSLIPLGQVESGAGLLEGLDRTVAVMVEAAAGGWNR
ncbi:cyclophilin-like fold protein [Pseudoflavonifractor capillosus]|uniref:cyclophilin-like fold protein n=1 Tax=Pseudoflavonifractor capillosus TaxID=106588 RepID=UPI00195ACF0E|nr:cyclophilin-like fold protein [Pseudoflavonifractor capillosus]MBM6680155.1 hypothetical protein [Pseudoflavonifractor capillosus]